MRKKINFELTKRIKFFFEALEKPFLKLPFGYCIFKKFSPEIGRRERSALPRSTSHNNFSFFKLIRAPIVNLKRSTSTLYKDRMQTDLKI